MGTPSNLHRFGCDRRCAARSTTPMTPAEAGRKRAAETPPLPDWCIEQAARIYAAWLQTRNTQDPRAA